MRERKIKMTPADVQNFVNEASKCDFDIDISYNHYTVDAGFPVNTDAAVRRLQR